jgi:hypothetical protein
MGRKTVSYLYKIRPIERSRGCSLAQFVPSSSQCQTCMNDLTETSRFASCSGDFLSQIIGDCSSCSRSYV